MRLNKYYILIVFTLFSLVSEAGERYHTNVIPNGTMIFFNPTKLTSKSKGCALQYDMTVRTTVDSVAVNMTLKAKQNLVSAVTLKAGDVIYTTDEKKIFFSDRKGSKYLTRIHISCPIGILKKLFTSSTPMSIQIKMKDGSTKTFVYKTKKWNYELMDMGNMFELYKL